MSRDGLELPCAVWMVHVGLLSLRGSEAGRVHEPAGRTIYFKVKTWTKLSKVMVRHVPLVRTSTRAITL